MAVEKIQVPDLGSDDAVEVIEVLVKIGDKVSENDSLVVLESDKAAMEIPSPKSGIVKQVLVKVGDQVKHGADLVALETDAVAEASKPVPTPAAPVTAKETVKATVPASVAKNVSISSIQSIKVPDLGDAHEVEVIEILVKVGDVIQVEAGLVTLETDKAAMDVPSPAAGKVVAIKIKLGDKVSAGSIILDLETSAVPQQVDTPVAVPVAVPAAPTASVPITNTAPIMVSGTANSVDVYAGPAVRKLARELGVDLALVAGSGGKNRIVKEDIQGFVKSHLQNGKAAIQTATTGYVIPPIEDIDFSKFGAVEELELSKLHRVTAQNMARNWLNVPHVTQFDEADVTDLEEFRTAQKSLADKKGIKLSPLPFIVKACAQALHEYPQFNVSLHSSGTKLIHKKYIHIGVAVATPAGLMVPVIKNVDQKSIWQIANEIAVLSTKAKDRKLTREDMEGGCFTISSLGNIGGTGFTPIVNAPEVAILGVSKAAIKPVYKNGVFVPRTLLPFALSYDHRAVNGVDGGMFCTYLAGLLSDIRLLIL